MQSCVNKRSKKTSGTFTKEITSPQTGNNDRHQEDDKNNLLSIGDEDVAGNEGKNSQIAVYGLQHCQVPDVLDIESLVYHSGIVLRVYFTFPTRLSTSGAIW